MDSFYGLDSLQRLFIQRTPLKVLPPLRPVKDTLASLDIAQCDISLIPFDYFIGFTILRFLYLQFNMINNSEKNLEFSALCKTLEVLNLSHNALRRIPYSLYSVIYPQLKTLSFNHNAISHFERHMLRAWPNISRLHISNNKIQTFGGLFYNRPWVCPGTEAIALVIYNNQLDCTFVETWVPKETSNNRYAEYCIQAGNRIFHVQGIHVSECASPPGMKGVSLLYFSKGHWWHHEICDVCNNTRSSHISPWIYSA